MDMAAFCSGLPLRYRRAIYAVALVLLPVALSVDCSSYTDCSSCAAVDGCSWALVYNCTWRCLSPDISEHAENDNFTGNPLRKDCWRYAIESSDRCGEEHNASCEALKDGIVDRSFEKNNEASDWIYARKIGLKDSKFCGGFYLPVEGHQYLVVGSSNDEGGLDYKVTTEGLIIPEDATHLSLYFMTNCANSSKEEMDELTSFTITLNGRVIFRLDRFNCQKYWIIGSYRVMDIKITDDILNASQRGSDKKHSLQITFTEYLDKYDITYNYRSFIFVDYVQVIKKNGKYTIMIIQIIQRAFFLDLSDTIYDHWDEYRSENGVSGECSTGCYPGINGNGICDMVCFTEPCKYDNDDCHGK